MVASSLRLLGQVVDQGYCSCGDDAGPSQFTIPPDSPSSCCPSALPEDGYAESVDGILDGISTQLHDLSLDLHGAYVRARKITFVADSSWPAHPELGFQEQ